MSRRHKENEIDKDLTHLNEEPQKVALSGKTLRGLIERVVVVSRKCARDSKLSIFDLFGGCGGIDYVADKIEVDDRYVKIPRDCFDETLENFICSQAKEKTAKRGRPTIRQLFNNIADCKIVRLFKKTKKVVKEKCAGIFQDMKQFCVCFIRGAYRAFSPHEDPYGKLSHYHRIISCEVEDIPCRKTLSDAYNWFVGWRRTAIETIKEEIERKRYQVWEKLMEWIYRYLIRLAPQYVVS